MDRYELSDGKSHKFWAAEVEGGELTTKWGRIGTDGQSKTKSLGSAEAADKELTKLIRAKTKKGYLRVGEDAPTVAKPAAAKQAAAKPTSVVSASDDLPDETVVDAAALAKFTPPVTHGAAKPVTFLALDAAWERFCGEADPLPAAARVAKDEAFDGLGSALDGLLKGELIPFPPSPEAAGLLMTRLAAASGYYHHAPALLDVAIATSGVAYALEAFLVAISWAPIQSFSKFSRGDRGFDSFIEPNVVRLRSIACASTKDYEAMLDAAKRFEPMLFGQRAARAFIFPSVPEFRAEVMAEMKTLAAGLPRPQNDQERGEQHRLGRAVPFIALMLLRDVTRAEEVALIDEVSDLEARDLMGPLAQLGAAITPTVMKRAEAFDSYGGREKREEVLLAALLAATPSDEPIQWLIRKIERTHFRFALFKSAEMYPVRVLTHVGPLVARRSKAASFAEALTLQIVRRHPAALDRSSHAWTTAERVVVKSAIAKRSAAEPVDAGSLPTIFTKPRWAEKRPKAKKFKSIWLKSLKRESRMNWPEGLREEWLASAPDSTFPPSTDWRALFEKDSAHIGAETLATAPVEIARPYAESWSPGEEDPYKSTGWERRLVARHELDVRDAVGVLLDWEVPAGVICALPFDEISFAVPMADAYWRLRSVRKEAREWLLLHIETALTGLIPVVLCSKRGEMAARSALAMLVGEGHGPLLLEVAGRYGDDAKVRAEHLASHDRFDEFPNTMPSLPSWCDDVDALEVKGGGRLPREAMNVFMTMLAISTPEQNYAGVECALEHIAPRSLGGFSWSLFHAWRVGGMDAKQAWAFHQMSFLGDDECVRKLAPILKAWPGDGGHARATTGLEILAKMGSDVALMHIYGMSQKLKYKGLKRKAAEKVEEIAEDRGLSKLELADRLVPRLDLDENGSMSLDFGPRQFTVTFDEALKPLIRDESGKLRKSLPKPGAKDDATKASDATQRFKGLKKDIKTVATTQIARLETEMCEGRTWTQDDFQRFLVGHPLLIHVVRRLVWGVVIEGIAKVTFRVTEDSTFVSAEDETITLPEGPIVLVHRLQLEDSVATEWGDHLADYELLQPFDQVARSIYAVTPEELKTKSIARFKGACVPTRSVLNLEHNGWRRGEVWDGGIEQMTRDTRDGRFVLSMDPGMRVGPLMAHDEQTLGTIFLSADEFGGRVDLKAASAMQLSEVIRSLDPLRDST